MLPRKCTMKFVVVAFASVLCCAFIWTSDGQGAFQLVDLRATNDGNFLQSSNGVNTVNNQYWLYTRANPTKHQLLVHGNASSIFSSNYQGDRPTKVIVHGWSSDANAYWIPKLTSALLDVDDVNVIIVDWSETSSILYFTSILRVPDIGRNIAEFLSWLFKTGGGGWNYIHLIGHSLGAHIVGSAGQAASGLPVRVTGLDPSAPMSWLLGGNANTLNRSSGVYVECIHTDGGYLGIMDPQSDADFYPNGGINPQPGCILSPCSHARAPLLFASSVRTNHFVGRLCLDLNQASTNKCTGSTLNMGNSILTKRGSGLYSLTTESVWPF